MGFPSLLHEGTRYLSRIALYADERSLVPSLPFPLSDCIAVSAYFPARILLRFHVSLKIREKELARVTSGENVNGSSFARLDCLANLKGK